MRTRTGATLVAVGLFGILVGARPRNDTGPTVAPGEPVDSVIAKHVLTLQDPPLDGGLHLGAFVRQLPDGRFAVAPVYPQGRVLLYHPDGRFDQAIGRRGDGPGEFTLVRSLDVDDAGGLHVFSRRHIRFGADLKSAATGPVLPSTYLSEFHALPDGGVLVAGIVPTRDRIDRILHVLSSTGEWRSSFDDAGGTVDFRAPPQRPASVCPDGTVWATQQESLVLKHWTPDGALLDEIDIPLAWLDGYSASSRRPYWSAPLKGHVWRIRCRTDGNIWVLGRRAAPEWKFDADLQRAGVHELLAAERRLVESKIIVVDVRTRTIAAAGDLAGAARGFASDTLLYYVTPTPVGSYQIDVFRIGS